MNQKLGGASEFPIEPPSGGMPGSYGEAAGKVQQLTQRLVVQLHMVLRTLRLYEPGNQALLIATENLKDTINTLWAAVEGPVQLQFIEGFVYVNEARIRLEPAVREQVQRLQEELTQRGLGGISFGRPVDSAALGSFLAQIARPVEPGVDFSTYEASLEGLKELAVRLLAPSRWKQDPGPAEVRVDKKTFALQTYAKAIIAVREYIAGLRAGAEPDRRLRITRIVQDLVDIATERVNFLVRLSAIKQAHDYAANHAANTCVLSLVIGRALGVDRIDLVDLGTSALLADVGFSLLPPEQIEHGAELSSLQRERLRLAMISQVRAIIGSGPVTDATLRRIIVAYEHHQPYRDPSTGERNETHLFSRIVQVADAFDALTTRRPWREGYAADEALRLLLEDADRRFDPLVVRILVNLLGLYPLGTAVRLETGEIAVVYHNGLGGQRQGRPWVRILIDAQGRRVARTEIRDLSALSGPPGRIVATVRPAELAGMDPGMALFL